MGKVSALTAATAVTAADELYVVDGLLSKKVTAEVLAYSLSTVSGAVNVKDGTYGAVGDGVTDDTTAIQAAMDAASAAATASPSTSAVFLYVPAGKYLVSQITHKDKVIVVGDGLSATEFYLKDGTNDHMFITPNFATLTNTDVCTPAEGVLHNIGYAHLRMFGNKANNTAGDGVRMIAKNPYFDHVVIQDFKGNGWYSELGQQCGVSNWDILGGGWVNDLRIFRNDGHGWHMRGPHDCYVNMLKSYVNTVDGVHIENNAGSYNPTLDFNHLHTFGNTGYGIYVNNAPIKGTALRAEDNQKEGIYFESAQDCAIAVLQLNNNCQTSGDYQCVIDTASNQVSISNLQARKVGRAAAGGVQVAGDNCHIDGTIQGDVEGGGNSTGVGLDLPNICQYNKIGVTIQGFLGVGGIGLRTGQTAGINYNMVVATLQNCDTLWNNVTAGVGNHYKISGSCDAADTRFAGVGPPSGTAARETWDVTLRDSTPSVRLSDNRVLHGTTADLNITTEQSFTIPHILLVAPNLQDCSAELIYTGTNTVYSVQYCRVKAVDATNVTVVCKLSVAAGAAETGNIALKVRI